MNEKHFVTEVKNSLKAAGCSFAYKIPDFPQSMLTGARFNPAKPLDIVAAYGPYFLGIECKQIKEYRNFRASDVRPSQLETLCDLKAKGTAGFIFLNIRIAREVNKLVIFDWATWWPILARDNKIEKASLIGAPGIPGRKGLFDLKPFLMARFYPKALA